MSDIVEFLQVRIAEDEIAVEGHAFTVTERDTGVSKCPHPSHRGGYPATCWRAQVGAKVLAECEAKRRIVDLHSGNAEWCGWTQGGDGVHGEWGGACDTLLALAQPYADHPDFDPAWRLE